MTHSRIAAAAICVASLALTGCASIVHSGFRSITINSQPPGASVEVTTADHQVVVTQTTPCTVSLAPKAGYFKGQHYFVKFNLSGYRSAEVEILPTLSGWYFGNIVFGGVIGMVIVDPLTGAMWNLSPKQIDQGLSAGQAALIRDHHGFVVALLSDTTPAERASMTRIR